MSDKQTAVVKFVRKLVNEQNLSEMGEKWKAKIDELQKKTAVVKARNGPNYVQFCNEKWRESTECLFIYFWLVVLVY